MKDSIDPSLAAEVRTISVVLENLNASRKRHDDRSIERHDKINQKLQMIGEYIASSNEFRNTLTAQMIKMSQSIEELIALKYKAQGGWWVMCTFSAVIGSILTFVLKGFIK